MAENDAPRRLPAVLRGGERQRGGSAPCRVAGSPCGDCEAGRAGSFSVGLEPASPAPGFSPKGSHR